MTLHTNIRGIQFIMSLMFLIFSYIPFVSTVFILILGNVAQNELNIITITIGFATILCAIVIIGIFQARLSLRIIGTGYFSLGTLIGFSDVYSLALGVILTWIFYENWSILAQYNQLDQEYKSYPRDSVEIIQLNKIFRNQIFSFLFIAWIALSLSWGILLLSSNFFIQLGKNRGVGTLGITISISLLLLLFTAQKYIIPQKR